jgi:hypothetical protein
MDIKKKYRTGYLLHKTETSISLCKILNEYKIDEVTDAENDLIDLLTSDKTEKEILKEYSKRIYLIKKQALKNSEE